MTANTTVRGMQLCRNNALSDIRSDNSTTLWYKKKNIPQIQYTSKLVTKEPGVFVHIGQKCYETYRY